MKKKIVLLGGLFLVFLCALFVQGYLTAPGISELEPALGIGDNNNCYVAARNKNALELYEIGINGKIKECFPLKIMETDTVEEVVRIRYESQNIYSLIEHRSLGTGQPLKWTVYRTGLSDGWTKELGTVDYTLLSGILDMEVKDGQAAVLGKTENKQHLAVYVTPPEAGDSVIMELKRMEKIPEGETVAEGILQNEVIFIRTDNGKVGSYRVDGFSKILQEAAGERVTLFHGSNDGWYYDTYTGQLAPLTIQDHGTLLVIPQRLRLTVGELKDENFMILGTNASGSPVLWCGIRLIMNGYEEFSVSAKVCMELSKPYILRTIAGFLLMAGGIWMVWRAYGKNGRLSLQLSILTLAFSVVLGGVWILFLKSSGIRLLSQKSLFLLSLSVLAGMIVIYSLFVESLTRPLRRLGHFMDKVASGNYLIQKTSRTNDEIGRVWSSMNKMCVELEKNRYQAEYKLKSYGRFVPGGMEKILGYQSLLELQAGDMADISGNVAMISVQNRDEICDSAKDSGYLELVTYCFSLIREIVRRYGAVPVSNEIHLSGIRLLYPEGSQSAVPSCMELLTVNREKRMEAEMFLMVHHTSYLYGLAGDKERAFPFFASGEIEFLESMSSNFRGTHVGMIMTEQALRRDNSNCDNRYIGYLTFAKEGRAFRIYELLDVCPYVERVMKKKLNTDFQKAIQYFYKNDFYLARNLFSAIVKECPYDGIARWYLFACEYYFNLGDLSQVSYGLFDDDYTDKAGEVHEGTV